MLTLHEVERQRLRAIVDAESATLERLHTPGFLLCTPNGVVWDRATYLGGLADGSIRYSRFEPQGQMECMESDGVGWCAICRTSTFRWGAVPKDTSSDGTSMCIWVVMMGRGDVVGPKPPTRSLIDSTTDMNRSTSIANDTASGVGRLESA